MSICPKLRSKIVIVSSVFLSISLGLVAGEILLRNSWRFGITIRSIEMWRYAREVKTQAVSPEIGFVHRPQVESTLMGVRVRTDEFGFRKQALEERSQILKSQKTILVLGDSPTLGWGVLESESYPALLEKKLSPKYKIYNTAVAGTNMSMQVNYLKEILHKVRPVWVILGYSIMEPQPNGTYPSSFWVKNSAVVYALHVIMSGGKKLSYPDNFRFLYQENRPAWLRWLAAVELLKKLQKEYGFAVTTLLIPEMRFPFNQGPFRDCYDKVTRIFEKNRFEVIDPSLGFPSGKGYDFWVDSTDPHPNSRAHAILASYLFKSKNMPHSKKDEGQSNSHKLYERSADVP